MNKIIKIILIFFIAIFGAGVLFTSPVYAQPPIDPLVVQFETTPLFNEANFLPGQSVTRWVEVTNNSGSTQRIATEAINKTDPNNLSEKLNLTIKEGTTEIFNNTLKKFFDQGETYLSSLENGLTTQYDFTVSFNSETDNSFQGKALGFDILVGFEGTEGGLPLPSPGEGTSGGGGTLPPGLTIYNEATVEVTTISVTITWSTSYYATAYVIYGAENEVHTLNLSDNSGIPPKYGYAHTTSEYDTLPKTINHSITIIGLTPGTKYYYRAVSHASLAISQEFSFTTLEREQIISLEEQGEAEGTGEIAGVTTGGEEKTISEGKTGGVIPGSKQDVSEESVEEGKNIVEQKTGEKTEKPFINLSAEVFGLTSFNFWILLILIIIIIILIIIRKKKREKDKNQNNQVSS